MVTSKLRYIGKCAEVNKQCPNLFQKKEWCENFPLRIKNENPNVVFTFEDINVLFYKR